MKDEYVRKQDALDVISCDITITGKENAEIVCKAIASFADGIKALPSADVTPVVHGRWSHIAYLKGIKVMECSHCGKRVLGAHNYCGNCGAKMDGEE